MGAYLGAGATKRVCLSIDLQYDFLPGGSLAVPGGDQIFTPLGKLLGKKGLFTHLVLSQDWHLPGHASFASTYPGRQPFTPLTLPNETEQMLWPDHCLQGSRGAEIHPRFLEMVRAAGFDEQRVVQKGTALAIDSYSAFWDNNHEQETLLLAMLKTMGIEPNDPNVEIYVVGLALDYCVKFTALDAIQKAGFKNVFVIEDATRPVNLQDGEAAKVALRQAGVKIIHSDSLLGGEAHYPDLGAGSGSGSATTTTTNNNTNSSNNNAAANRGTQCPSVLVCYAGGQTGAAQIKSALAKRPRTLANRNEIINCQLLDLLAAGGEARLASPEDGAIVIMMETPQHTAAYEAAIMAVRLAGKQLIVVRWEQSIRLSDRAKGVLRNSTIMDAFRADSDPAFFTDAHAKSNAINALTCQLFHLLYPEPESRRNPQPGPFMTQPVPMSRFFQGQPAVFENMMILEGQPDPTDFTQAEAEEYVHQLSEYHHVTLGPEARRAAGIAEAARTFRWVYQSAMGTLADAENPDTGMQARLNLGRFGAFAYFSDEAGTQLLQVNAIAPGAGLFFERQPLRFLTKLGDPNLGQYAQGDKEILPFLLQGQCHDVTIPVMLHNTNVKRYLWLKPCTFAPHGGFGYEHDDGVVEVWLIANPDECERRYEQYTTFQARQAERRREEHTLTQQAMAAAVAAGSRSGASAPPGAREIALTECSICLGNPANALIVPGRGSKECHTAFCTECAKGFYLSHEHHCRGSGREGCSACLCPVCRQQITAKLRVETFPTPGGLCGACKINPINAAALHGEAGIAHLILCRSCAAARPLSCPAPGCRHAVTGTLNLGGLHAEE